MKFPKAVLGTMYYGTTIDEPTAHRMIDTYLDSGMDMLDTANNYAFWITGSQGGESETAIGNWLRRNRRKTPRIATKIGARPISPGLGLESAEGLSERSIRRAVEGSLQRLGVDQVALLYAHIDDTRVPLEESLGTLSSLVDEEVIQHYGISNLVAERLRAAFAVVDANGLHPITALQQRYSVILPPPDADVSPHVIASADVQRILSTENVPLVAYSPLIEGALSDVNRDLPPAYNTAENRRARTLIAEQAQAAGCTLSQLVMRRLVEEGVVPLLGARTEQQLEDSLRAFA